VLLQLLFYTQQVNCQQQQRRSPCPSVFSYDIQSTSDDDTWYGTLKLQSTVQLYGITVDMIFDRRVTEFGAYHFSEATTSDNLEFRVENKNFQLDPGRTLVMNVYVKYRNYMPLVKQIRMNGQNVCVDVPIVQPVIRPSNQNNNGGASQYEYDSTTSTRKTTRRENPSR
jgi:Serine protease gd N-terminus